MSDKELSDKCLKCVRGLHTLCTGCPCTHEALPEPEEEVKGKRGPKKGTRYKPDHALKDQQSTGRKRAAALYPVICTVCETPINLRDKECGKCEVPAFPPCDWREKANCGGGTIPIIGCLHGVATDRHHGPDKKVTNNEPGNVHRICSPCHHTWHAKNDPGYDLNRSNYYPEHSPRDMTSEELFLAMIQEDKRKTNKLRRLKD